ncbi:hypothetical protein EYV94_03465 [Puteibacter caeruleilacunae]|nr:hypothetical protein EYV94_03465 [Puteibacter caeruleilacunae]
MVKVLGRLIGLFIVMLLSWIGLAQERSNRIISGEKQLDNKWFESLYSEGSQKVYRGEELTTIGMPCGGIAAGQLYVTGDGTLANWWIANNAYNTGYGVDSLMNFQTSQGPWKVCYQTFKPQNYFKQGFSVTLSHNGKKVTRNLDKSGFNDIGFIGEYPIAKVLYEDNEQSLPVSINMEVFSPFIPLSAKESATPATIFKFRIKNTSSENINAELSGYLQNIVMNDLKGIATGEIRNQAMKQKGIQSLFMDYISSESSEKEHPYNGNISLSLLSDKGSIITNKKKRSKGKAKTQLGNELIGEVCQKIKLSAGEEKEIVFLLTWFFPNRPKDFGNGHNWTKPIPTKGPIIRNMYANWFNSSLDVASYLKANFNRLDKETHAFHESWYRKSNLPYWLKQRIMMPVSTLATETCQWWADDTFWAWEGVGSCVGTCTHVYNYVQAIAHLFPELERNVREKTDLGKSFDKQGGISYRIGWGKVAMDGQMGTILKCYREHLMSKDNSFLERNWTKIKMAMEYAIKADGNDDGLIEGAQHNTYDISFYGPNTYVGGLYLAALKAAEQMALIVNDNTFAEKCRKIYLKGSKLSVEQLWNGRYFIQKVDLQKHSKNQYANGCLSDQLFGQTWAHLLDLGYIYPQKCVETALQSIWEFNWTKDVGTYNEIYTPERYFAHAGEPGLFNCTFPLGKHLNKNSVRYRNEVWSGLEYQVATNMIYDGLLDNGLSIVKGVHERYRPEKHNPWNEIECGDHYARAMASWGILTALEGFNYDGPKGKIEFAPRTNNDSYNGFFIGAEGWGDLSQNISGKNQFVKLRLEYGSLVLNELELQSESVESVEVTYKNKKCDCEWHYEDGKLVLSDLNLTINKGEQLNVKINYSEDFELSILSDQVGYNSGEKIIVYFRSNYRYSGLSGESYSVEDLEGNIITSGSPKFKGNKWSANWWTADFRIEQSGDYLLKLLVDDNCFCSDTLHVEKDMLWKSCFSTIAIDMMKERSQHTVTGKGWRDCGGDLQELSSHVVALDGLCDVIELASDKISAEEYNFILKQMIRGTDFIVYYQDLAKEKGLGDGAVVHESRQIDIVTGNVAKAAYIFARVARLLNKDKPRSAKHYLERSKRAYNWISKNGPIINKEEQRFYAPVHGAPTGSIPPTDQWMTRDLITMLRASIELYKNGEKRYKDDAIELARQIMKRQIPRTSSDKGLFGHFYTYGDFSSFGNKKFSEKGNIHCGAWSKEGRIYNKGGHYPHYILPFIEMKQLWNNHPAAKQWDQCLRNFAYGYFAPVCNMSPFKLLPAGYYNDEGVLYFGNWYHAHNNLYSFAAILGLEFEKYFNDSQFHEIAMGNLQWITGLNCGWKNKGSKGFKSYSMIAGVGHRTKGSWTGIPGTICNGFSASRQFRIQPIDQKHDLPVYFDDEGYIAHSLPFVGALVRLIQNDIID